MTKLLMNTSNPHLTQCQLLIQYYLTKLSTRVLYLSNEHLVITSHFIIKVLKAVSIQAFAFRFRFWVLYILV